MRRALTLIELVLTISLAGLLGIPTGGLVTEHLRVAMTSRDSTMALQLARQELERLDGLQRAAGQEFFVDLPLGTTTTLNYRGSPYTLTRAITCAAGNCTSTALANQGLKRIEVVVTRPGSPAQLAKLISYRTKHVWFGG